MDQTIDNTQTPPDSSGQAWVDRVFGSEFRDCGLEEVFHFGFAGVVVGELNGGAITSEVAAAMENTFDPSADTAPAQNVNAQAELDAPFMGGPAPTGGMA